ncbi:hypothetical protein WMY93_021753 [Mugilogobius chulae]|uniref:Uncharacterized protein n=1 Tax=Mugilogobius chulae TaxID=88201 RepID=A0AAW0NIQ3_9GOBI
MALPVEIGPPLFLNRIMWQEEQCVGRVIERELDHAMLRRLEKRILVGLPSAPARQAMVSHCLPPLSCTHAGVELRTELDYEALAQVPFPDTLKRLVPLHCCRPIPPGSRHETCRKIFDALESIHNGDTDVRSICLETITMADFLEVIAHTKPSARSLEDKYSAWERQYKSV